MIVGERRGGDTHSWRSLEDRLEAAHTLVGTVDAEDTFYFGSYVVEHTTGDSE